MFSAEQLTLTPESILYAASVALAATLVSLVGCFLSRVCWRSEAPVRHAILVTTVAVGVACPILLVIGPPIQSGWLRLAVPVSASQRITATHSARGSEIVHDSTAIGTTTEAAASFQNAEVWNRIAASWQGWGTALVLLWLLGVLCGVASAARGVWILVRFLQTLRIIPHPRLVAAVGDAFRSVGSDRQARIFVTPFAPAPFTLGLLRPLIVIPEYLAADSAEERLRSVLTHEVAHVVRRDQWVAILQRLAGILYWWNPLFRSLNRQLSQSREEICDDYVLQSAGEGRKFAATLLDVAERTALFGLPEGTALLDDDAKSLEQRIRRLLVPRPIPTTRLSGRTRLATILFGVMLSGIVLAARVQSDETASRIEPASRIAAGDVARAEIADPPARAGSNHVAAKGDSAASNAHAAAGAIDLSGNWLLTLPAGFEHPVVLEPLGQNRYRLTPPVLTMSGIYELRGAEFRLVEPHHSRLTEFKWQAQNLDFDSLLLVAEPPPGKTGAKYLGATLTWPVGDHHNRTETSPRP